MKWEGVWAAVITPFKEGRLDEEAFGRLIDHLVAGGIDGLVPCGTTGESATLTHEEHEAVIRACLARAKGRVPVVAGTGSNSTSESIALTRAAKEAGADAALLITPYYNKPTQEGLYRHYRAVAEAVDIPIVLYNVPGRTAVDMKPETVARLAEIPNIVAIKEATGDMQRASQIRVLCGDRITLFSGDDATFFPFLAVGGKGCISVVANIAPRRIAALWQAWKRGDLVAARAEHEALLEINGLLFCETSPIPVKAAAEMLGLAGPEIRMPLTPITEANRQRLRRSMETLGLFA
ncbi:MAG: 4-hydroxy-tetrahydrodipicolinate synthase [Magnetococcales bacterium]|nr:4-hydroxy-tetrahydrodipicolinate synthase [Magnetococcales bacterium]MBF0156733.1 4-hydroxy-tetrahydrodipicolinate synthase [Magnetococcales bacterium]